MTIMTTPGSPANRHRRATLAALAAVSAVTLGACGSGEDSSTAESAESPASSVVVSAETSSGQAPESPEETSTTPAESAAPEAFTSTGWGDIQIGMTKEEVDALGYSQSVLQAAQGTMICTETQIDVDGGTVYATYKAESLIGVSSASAMAGEGQGRTAEGLAVGDPASKVSSVYPDAQEVTTQAGAVTVVTDPSDPMSAMSFATSGGQVSDIRSGDAEYAKRFESCIDFSGGAG